MTGSGEAAGGTAGTSRSVLAILAVVTGFGLAANAVWTAINVREGQRLERWGAEIASEQQRAETATWRAVERTRQPVYPVVPMGSPVVAPIVVPRVFFDEPGPPPPPPSRP